MSPDDCLHLTVADVEEVHRAVIDAFGGTPGLRDRSLLESAVAAPQATAFGRSPFESLTEVAAAYLFYLCRNHPFLDGNKRVALTAALVFLRLNDVDTTTDGDAWYTLVMDVAASRIDREQTSRRLETLLQP